MEGRKTRRTSQKTHQGYTACQGYNPEIAKATFPYWRGSVALSEKPYREVSVSTLYLVFPQGVEAPSPLPSRVASFYRWLYRWYTETGDLHACTGYYARKQGVSERTVYRWLALLRSLQFITTEQTPGVERRITPHLPPPKTRPKTPKNVRGMSGVRVRGSSSIPDALEASTTGVPETVTHPALEVIHSGADDAEGREVVSALADVGVLPVVAVHLVKRYGLDPVRVQLEAMKHRTVRDRAGALVASIRNNWPLPSAMVKQQQEARKLALRASERAFRMAMEQNRQDDRERLLQRLRMLSEGERGAIFERARKAIQQEQPVAYRLIEGKAGFEPWVHDRVLKLLAEQER